MGSQGQECTCENKPNFDEKILTMISKPFNMSRYFNFNVDQIN